LFHFDRVSWIELRWMNRSDHWQKSCLVGRVLLTPGSTLTLIIVYHPVQKRAPILPQSSNSSIAAFVTSSLL
jgi:hypothetical protein